MSTTTDADRTATTATTEVDAGYFDPIVLHYVKKGAVTESAVLGTEVIALCGERWTADENDYDASLESDGKTVLCPLCGYASNAV